MTTHALNNVSVPSAETSVPDTRLIETVVLRRCAQYRKAFAATAVSYPADALRFYPVARWIRRHRVTVDVRSAQEFRQVSSSGVLVPQIVMHCAGDVATQLLHCAVNVGVGRFVVDSVEQVAALATAMGRMRQVIVDVAAPDVELLAAKVVENRRLNLIGLHCRLDDNGDTTAVDAVQGMVAQMARLRRVHPVILTRISLANVDAGEGVERRALRRHAEAVEDAVEDACIWFRHPRPALTLAPAPAVLLMGMEYGPCAAG
jgi:Pyridoxal-dependent decarboxylase, pyridoxal binding domain